MDTALKIALTLTAFDKASGVIDALTNKANANFDKMQAASKKIGEGWRLIAAGEKGFEFLKPAVDAFGDLQEAGNDLRASMLKEGGILDESTYSKIMGMSERLSDTYKGSSASYLDMTRILKNNRIDEKDILGGIGESTAKLADLFKMPSASIAEFSAHMKNDMGVAVNQMGDMMDLVARVHNSGVGKTGSEAVTEMNEFFGKTSLGLANLGVQGIESTKQIGALGAMFMSRGLSGQTVGTNFRRIWDAMRDGDKLSSVIDTAKKYGVALQFFDKNNKFLGIENFVTQIGKLQNLDASKTSEVFKGFAGKQGLSTDFIEFLAKNGVKGYDEYMAKIKDQGTLDQKLQQIMGGLNYEQGVMETSWTNLKATFGSALAPALTGALKLLNGLIATTRMFLEEHPAIAKFATTFIAVASAGLMLGGIIKVIQGVSAVMRILNITMLANPVILISAAIIAAAALIYANWDDISAFFGGVWESIKSGWNSFWGFIKNAFLNFTPAGLIIKYWDKLPAMFSAVWHAATKPFIDGYNMVIGLGHKFWDAGKNIVHSIWDGMKSDWHLLEGWFEDKLKALREYLPFSPAKRGPLRDIHRIKFIETIAGSLRPQPLMRAMDRTMGQVANYGGRDYSMGRGGGSSTIHFSPTIHLNGTATQKDADLLTSNMKRDVLKIIQDEDNRKKRVGYS